MSTTSFLFLSFSISIMFPLLACAFFLIGVRVGASSYPKDLVIEEEPESGYVPYKNKESSLYKAYVPNKEEEIDN